ncbi:hypothetical protein ABZU94_10785 [Streptomyces mirabilis]|uniref:hypothetical protein n=1 Tax=Streptomyces sp. NPDC005388 TaxID=3156717 RepID=UPI0033A49250
MLIILAGALGALLLNVLLFRRLRQLSWQLARLRVERDCERILRELGKPAEIHLAERENARDLAFSRIPVRSKAHLSLYRGGLVAAWVTSRRHQRHFAAAASTAVFAAAAVVAVLLTAPNRDLPGLPYDTPPGLGSSDHPLSSRSPTGNSRPAASSSGDEALMSADQGMSVNGVHSPRREVSPSASPSPSLATPRPPGTTAPEQPAPTHDPTSLQPSATPSPIGSASLLNLCVDAGPLDLDICARL